MVGFGLTISEKVKGNKLIILEMNFFRKKREKIKKQISGRPHF